MLRNPACLLPTPDNLFFPPRKGDYVYFEAPRLTSEASPWLQASWAADAAMFAYARYGKTRMTGEEFTAILHAAGFETVASFGDCFADNASTARGFFAAHGAAALLAFRGTEKDNLYDLAADADALLVPHTAGRVHEGFLHYFHSIWWSVVPLLRAYRADHPTQPLLLTGHSLGAAIASLAFAELADAASSLMTFGCPHVGDRAFCERIESHPNARACCRVVDNRDLVTHIPLRIPGVDFEHPRIQLLWFDPQGQPIEDSPEPMQELGDLANLSLAFLHEHVFHFLSKELPRPLADHSPVRYCHWVSEALRRQRP